ncbi:hypothetical protein BDZ89DRAFT_1120438 [Hymenopellis radicata]|nr:hypothetical protein BDZ89DRAFT_1120438 [Hymenopellis radicata]
MLHLASAALAVFLCGLASAYQAPLSIPSKNVLITPETDAFVHKLIADWNSTGLSVAVVRKDPSVPGGWRREFGSYSIAKGNGSLVNPDTMYAIASNSKLFLALSVGLIISNDSLADARGGLTGIQRPELSFPNGLSWTRTCTVASTSRTCFPIALACPDTTFQISTLRHLRPSAEFRQTFQYNNLMYETLSYLPSLLLNQTYESYIHEHIAHLLQESK